MRSLDELLNWILDFYDKKFISENKGVFFTENCKLFVKDYFEGFREEFYNIQYKTILSFSEEETRVLRVRFGVLNGELSLKDRKDFERICLLTSKFQRKVFLDVDGRVKKFLFWLENYGIDSHSK